MSKSPISGRTTKREVAMNQEEEAVLLMYRKLARWEKNSLHVLMHSLAFGHMVAEKTDHMPWSEARKMFPFSAQRKEASHE